jgi:CheY-specific phosphatase CheX
MNRFMNPTASTIDLRELAAPVIAKVFANMLSLTVTSTAKGTLPHIRERVIGSIGFGGETATGAVFLHLPDAFSRKLTALMLGIPVAELDGDADVNDLVCELSNMLCGGLKSRLCDLGIACAMSTPSIIRGQSFSVDTPPDVRCEKYAFLCEGDEFYIEIHFQHANP